MFNFRSLTILSLVISVNCFILALPQKADAQQSIKDSCISINLISAHFAVQFPDGDVSERFGTNSMVGAGFMHKTANNWMLGIEGGFLFGNNVKNENTILANIQTSTGDIVDMEGIYANYHFYERGYSILAKAGRVFSWGKPNKNSGIMAGIGGGYLQHKILIDHRDRTAPQITGDYLKGYDELKGGPALNAYVGLLHLGNQKIANFYAGIDYTVAFTEHYRPYSFSAMKYTSGKFTDSFISLKAYWFIPIYKRAPKEYYYY